MPSRRRVTIDHNLEIEMQRQKLKMALGASALLLALSGSAGSAAAAEPFIKFDGIDGESNDKDHRGWLDLVSFSWGLENTSNGKRGCIAGLEITKAVDSATPSLLANAANGTSMPNAVLKVRKKGARQDYLVIVLRDVVVSSMRQTADNTTDGVTEVATLSFSQMSGTYYRQLADGSLGAAMPWNIGPAGKCP
jgi:type VI secretion system secreted protein Hcp